MSKKCVGHPTKAAQSAMQAQKQTLVALCKLIIIIILAVLACGRDWSMLVVSTFAHSIATESLGKGVMLVLSAWASMISIESQSNLLCVTVCYAVLLEYVKGHWVFDDQCESSCLHS